MKFILIILLYVEAKTRLTCEQLNDPKNEKIQREFVGKLSKSYYQEKNRSFFKIPVEYDFGLDVNLKVVQKSINKKREKAFWLRRLKEMEVMKYDPDHNFFSVFCAQFQVDNSFYKVIEDELTDFMTLKNMDKFKSFSYMMRLKFAAKILESLKILQLINYEVCDFHPKFIILSYPLADFEINSTLVKVKLTHIKSHNTDDPTCRVLNNPWDAPEMQFTDNERKIFFEKYPFQAQMFSFSYILMILFYNDKNSLSLDVNNFYTNYKYGKIKNFLQHLTNFEESSVRFISNDSEDIYTQNQIVEENYKTVAPQDFQLNFKILKNIIIRTSTLHPKNRLDLDTTRNNLLKIISNTFEKPQLLNIENAQQAILEYYTDESFFIQESQDYFRFTFIEDPQTKELYFTKNDDQNNESLEFDEYYDIYQYQKSEIKLLRKKIDQGFKTQKIESDVFPVKLFMNICQEDKEKDQIITIKSFYEYVRGSSLPVKENPIFTELEEAYQEMYFNGEHQRMLLSVQLMKLVKISFHKTYLSLYLQKLISPLLCKCFQLCYISQNNAFLIFIHILSDKIRHFFQRF